MTNTPAAGQSSPRRKLWPAAWIIVSSLIWAAVMIDTGEIAWPLAVWMATTFAPLSVLGARRKAEEAADASRFEEPDNG
jgi:membrane protease YdiL (CAAX protease family)